MANVYSEWKTGVWIVKESTDTEVAVGDRMVFFGDGGGTPPKNILGRIPRWGQDCNYASSEDKVSLTGFDGKDYIIKRSGTTLTCTRVGGGGSGTVVWTAVEGG